MLTDKMMVIARREFLTRVSTKGFWISTALLPLFMVAITLLPPLIMSRTTSTQRMVVVDGTGKVAPALMETLAERAHSNDGSFDFTADTETPGPDPVAQREQLDERVLAGEIDAWIWIDEGSLTRNQVEYHAENVANFATQETLERVISGVVRRERLQEAGLDPDQVGRLAAWINLDTFRLSEEGTRQERAEANFILAYILFMLLYMMMIIYGQQVMVSVIEEKTSRVVEVVVSSARPFDLMLGKLVGTCVTGLTQLAVWIGTVVLITSPAVADKISWLPAGFTMPSLPPDVAIHFFALFLLGFFVYASFYAALGASFNSTQEAQQLSTVGIIFLVASFMFLMPVINDPDSTLSVVVSLIPTFTPLIMMLRIVVKMPPAWQIGLGYLITSLFVLLLIWGAARIYRVGILMYGKKPTVKEILRWTRYA